MPTPTLSRLVAVVVAVMAVLCSGLVASAQESSPRTVLVIHWGPQEFPATPVVNAAIRQVFLADPGLRVDYFAEYLESDRVPPDQASRALRDYIQQKYRGRRIDLVIAIADPALRFVLEHRDALFPRAPIVYSGIAVPATMGATINRISGGFTAVTRGGAYRETLKLALELHPSTQQVFVVANSRDGRAADSAREQLLDFEQRVALTYVRAPTLPQLLTAIKGVPPRSLVLYIWHQQDDLARTMFADETARLVAQASPVPVYGTNDSYVGSGVVGGVARRTHETAARVGEMARQILRGTRPEDIPIEDARLVPIFDWREVRRWGIDPSRLPAGSDILFRVPTLWESYRDYIIVILSVIAAQLVLIAALLTQRGRRRRAEDALRARESALRTSYQGMRQLAGRLINAQERARADIARDLHDDLCQDLVGVSMAVGSLKSAFGNLQDAQTQHALETLHLHTLGMVDGVRSLSHELHPATLRLVGLAAALGGHCIEAEKRYDVQVSFKMEGDLSDIDRDVALCLFRITQEALRNGALHGEARRLAVMVTRSANAIELKVNDDGRGFDLDAARRDGTGLGLVSIEERAHVLGGQVQIITRPGYGTRVSVRIPVGAHAEAASRDVSAQVRVLAPQLLSKSSEQL